MQRRKLVALLVAAPLASPIGAPAQPADGPKARFEDDLFSRLEGNWLLTRKIRGTEFSAMGLGTRAGNFRMENQEKDGSRGLFAIDTLEREQ
jgi:hypothetical protein